jgi:metal-responsive CopG/Arc/MetJ family transcriptional regulator
MIRIIGIKVTDRIKEVGITQEVLSKYASLITTRFGFHELTTEKCSREAYIILHLNGELSDAERLISDLRAIRGVEVKEMDFNDRSAVINEIDKGSTMIFGLLIEKDHDLVIAVQKLLTSYGCVIRSRLGVNETFFGKPAGLIILELAGDKEQINLFEKDLKSLKNILFRKIVF